MSYEEDLRPIPPELTDFQPEVGLALICPDEKTSTSGGVLLSSGSVNTAIRTGIVVALGPPREEFGSVLGFNAKEGNRVLYDASRGIYEVNLDGKEHHVIRQSQVLGGCKVALEKYKPKPKAPSIQLVPPGFEAALPRPIREPSEN